MGCEFELDLLPGLCRWGASLNWIYTRLEQEPYTTFDHHLQVRESRPGDPAANRGHFVVRCALAV